MNVFTRWIPQIFKGALTAFKNFPISIASALAFVIVTIIRIQLDWKEQESYNFLLNCLSCGFALGAVFGLTVITAVQSCYNDKRIFKIANLFGAMLVLVTILILYIFGARKVPVTGAAYNMISEIAISRVSVAMLLSFIAFIIIAGYPKEKSDFARSLFMTQKAIFIAMLYGLVILAGFSGVAAAIKALLYEGMSSKVYMYISTFSGFLAFTVFLGYFPNFRKDEIDERLEITQSQPRFIEVLFQYIMIPIMSALTLVLLIWSGKTVFQGMKVSFTQLSGIATAYTIFGIWLHIMVTNYKSGIAKFYRLVYPFAGLVILAIEAWALFIQLQKYNLKTTEYFFIVIWITALISAILLIILKERSHEIISILICIMAIFSVLPVISYQDLPVSSQVKRLEKLFISQGMINNNKLSKAKVEPNREVRESITDAVNYLAYAKDAKLPTWFDTRLSDSEIFKDKLGFEQSFPNSEYPGNEGHLGTNLILSSEPLDISDYQWVINLNQDKTDSSTMVKGNKGEYEFYWNVDQSVGVPTLKVLLNKKVILEKNMKSYLDNIAAMYPPAKQAHIATIKEMSLQLDNTEVTILMIFRNISINTYPKDNITSYWLEANVVYMKEK